MLLLGIIMIVAGVAGFVSLFRFVPLSWIESHGGVIKAALLLLGATVMVGVVFVTLALDPLGVPAG